MSLPRMLVLGVALAAITLTSCTNEAQQPQQPAASQAPSARRTGVVQVVPSRSPSARQVLTTAGSRRSPTTPARRLTSSAVDLVLSEGTNDSAAQVSQVETLIQPEARCARDPPS